MRKSIAAVIVIVAILSQTFVANSGFAQDKDTTKIKVGKKRIIIIDEDANKSNDKLENGKLEFKMEIDNLEGKLKDIDKQIKATIDTAMLRQLKTQIDDLQKQKAALEKGIQAIEEEIAKGNKEEKTEIDVEKEIEKNLEKEFNENDQEKFRGHWSGFDLGLNNFMYKNGSMSLKDEDSFMEINTSKSWGFGLNILQYSIPLFSKYMGLVTGLGFQWNNFRLDGNYILEKDADGVIRGVAPADNKKLDKSTLNMCYVTAPLLYEFQIPVGKKSKPIHIGFGVTGSVKIASKTKQKIEGDKFKNKGDYQLSPFRYGLAARVGYRALNFFANYSLVPLFEKDKGPELYPFTIGLTLLNFN